MGQGLPRLALLLLLSVLPAQWARRPESRGDPWRQRVSLKALNATARALPEALLAWIAEGVFADWQQLVTSLDVDFYHNADAAGEEATGWCSPSGSGLRRVHY
uniref:Uncharacterized protein n=1 Tax=Rhizochromulina marina TaxID=1034831 RepID=A0A7S2WPI5_9STRA|mmetsp:Transcript_30111/g.87731  ORF Transcript_30111/g.87731 Transcript_30111/m.87731 type:complete len:103 (+) Transcript_30111:97-405(+)